MAKRWIMLLVAQWFKGAVRGIHNRGFGGLAINAAQETQGTHWHHLTDNAVQVTRHPDDPDVDQVRVVVVEADPPHYDSGWQPVAVGANPFAHNLNWNPNMMLARAECLWSTSGIHQRLAGGNAGWIVGRQGAHLQNLTMNAVALVR